MFLEEITGAFHPESYDFECKSRLDRNNTIGWLKTIAGFANASGGTFYIGVEDKSNKLIGFSREDADNERNYFNNQINEHITPRPPYKISFLRYTIRDQERFVLEVRVDISSVRPVIVKFNGIPSIFIRREGFTGGATYEEIIQMSIKSQSASYDSLPTEQKYHREDFKDLIEFHNSYTEGQSLSDKALASLGFFDHEGHLSNGAVLFKDNYQGHKTDIQCSVFSGYTRGSERIVTINRFSGNITSSILYAYDFVLQRMNHTIIKQEYSHVSIDAFPKRALFEGIMNAIAHRDYFLDGTQIQIDMFRDRLEISSPGSLFQHSPLGKSYDLSNIISKRRNEIICGVLVSCNVMEAAGTGFDKIQDEYKDSDEGHRPYVYSASDHFTLVLPDLTNVSGIKDSTVPNLEYIPVPKGSEHDDKIISFCYSNAQKAGDIAAHLGISDSTHLRKEILGNLVDNGYLTAEKVSRTVYYKTNRSIVRIK